MTDASTSAERSESILAQHKQLRVALDELNALLQSAPQIEATAGWLSKLAARLHDLLPVLAAHFEHEERSGLFAEIQAAWPETATTCARLLAEHKALLEGLEGVRVSTAAGPTAVQTLPELMGRGQALMRTLATHEEAENELLVRVLDGALAAQD